MSRPRRHPSPRPVLRLLVTLAAVAMVAVGCGDDTDESAADDDTNRLPALVLAALDGGEIDLAEPTDTPRVLNLWATWCAPCRAELPAFDEVAAEAPPTVAIVGVNVGDDIDSVESFVAELGLGFPQLLDPDAELNAALGVTNMPTTLFVEPDGTITFVHLGAVDTDDLTALVEEHLGVAISQP